MQIDVRATGVADAAIRFTGLADRLEDASPAFRSMITDLRDRERSHFNSLRGLSASTVARKMRSDDPQVRGNAERPLMGTGETFASVTGEGAGSVTLVRASSLTFGTSVTQARFHEPDRQGRTVFDAEADDLTRTMRSFLLQTTRGPA